MPPRVAALVVGLLVLSVGILVAVTAGGGGDGGGAVAAPVAAREQADGVLTRVEEDELVLQPYTSAPPQRFVVRPEDRVALDLPHLRLHVRDGTPVRLFFEREGGAMLARGYQDLLG